MLKILGQSLIAHLKFDEYVDEIVNKDQCGVKKIYYALEDQILGQEK